MILNQNVQSLIVSGIFTNAGKWFARAGVSGRHEIDETQELNDPAIMPALVDTRYEARAARESNTEKAARIASLKQAAGICDV